jgi:DNA-binding transcriptional ArsR family regulator
MNTTLTPELVALVAERLRTLGEPARLQILNALRPGDRTVGALQNATGLGQPNVSKHLRLLHSAGFVSRRKAGLYTYYSLADEQVFQICDLVCDRLEAELAARSRVLERG